MDRIHVHMIIFSTNPKEGYLTKQGIKQIKSALVRQVYKDDLLNVYQKQTVHRDRLKEKVKTGACVALAAEGVQARV